MPLIFVMVYSLKINSGNVMSYSFIKNISRAQKDWKAGRNFHRSSELKNLINVSAFKRKYKLGILDVESVKNIPQNFDARKHWPLCYSIRSIKMQGNCASSYAIVPASVFSDRLCIQKDIQRNSSSDQLLSCCKRCGGGCFGGHVEKSYMYMKDVGLVSGGDYGSKEGCRPYQIKKCQLKNKQQFCSKIRKLTPSCYHLKCTNKVYNVSYDNDKLKFKTVYYLPSDVDAIKSEIVKYGPVSASLTVYEDFFNYKSGIYYHTVGSEVGKHEVKLIGWGTSNKLKLPYWLAVNTWGKEWGDKGMFKIFQGVNECGIESNVIAGSFIKK